MPDGDRSRLESQPLNIITKIFSFFKFKNEVHDPKNSQHHELTSTSWEEYKTLKAEDIMIPRTDIIAMEYTNTLEDISKVFIKTRYTRMPIYKEKLDNIIGFINIKDIFPYLLQPKEHPKFRMDEILRKMLIISPSMKIFALLEEMRRTRTHIALVVDEFGGADGLITIEDLVEEIIGEVKDEHSESESELIDLGSNLFEAKGRIEIEALEERLNVKLTEEDGEKYDTLGGLILSITGKIPEQGAKITHTATGLMFEILESDPRRIKKVLISKNL